MKLSTQLIAVVAVGSAIIGVITGQQPAFIIAALAAIVAALDYAFSSPELPEAIAPAPVAEAAPVKKARKTAAKAPAAKAAKAPAKKPAAPKKVAAIKAPAKKTTKK